MALRNPHQNNVTGCFQLINVTHAAWEHQQVTHPVTQCDVTIIGLQVTTPGFNTALCNSCNLEDSIAVKAGYPSCYTTLRNMGGVQTLGFKLFSYLGP